MLVKCQLNSERLLSTVDSVEVTFKPSSFLLFSMMNSLEIHLNLTPPLEYRL